MMFSASRSLSSAAHALTALPLILLLASAMSAQDLDDVTLSGVVTDEHGALVVGAIVTAVPSTAGAARAVATDGEGRYRLVELAPGAYTVRVTRDGFTAQERTGLATNAGRHVRLDFTLRAAGPEAEAVVVSASEAPHVDTTRVVAGGALGSGLRLHARRRRRGTALDARRGRRPRPARRRAARGRDARRGRTLRARRRPGLLEQRDR
jgi:Carboxypeptidase regulatory-like domain